MKCWTAQYRYPGPNRLDISVKGNDPLGKYFAPTWEMLMEYKKGLGLVSPEILEKTYTDKYFQLLTKRMQENFTPFAELLAREYVVFVCFCAAGEFCHRILLAYFLQQLGVTYGGEIKDFSKWSKKNNIVEDAILNPIISFKNEYEWLSNFSPSIFEYDGITYPSNEHFYQAMKAKADDEMIIIEAKEQGMTWEEFNTLNVHKKFVQVNTRKYIASLPTPSKAKRQGRILNISPAWEQIKVDIMRAGLKMKFDIPELRTKLLATGNRVLVEGNYWHDNFWGECSCPKCQATKKAENMLGKLLMERRELIPFGK